MTAAELDAMVAAAKTSLARSIGTRAGIAAARIREMVQKMQNANSFHQTEPSGKESQAAR
jgi:hypothetical protein